MKKIKYWFYLTFLNRKQAVVDKGGFNIVFRNYDMRITTKSGNFSMKIRGGEYPFGYLAAAHSQGRDDQVHNYAQYMYLIAMMLCRDNQFKNDITSALNYLNKKFQRKAEKEAKKAEKAPEEAELDLVRKDIEAGQMSRRERRKASRKFKEEAKKVLNEDEQ